MYHFFISLIGRNVRLLAASYAAAQRIMILGGCCITFAQRTTTGLSVLVTCTSIVPTVWHDILLISSALELEDTWMESAHAWVFVVKQETQSTTRPTIMIQIPN